MIRVAIADHQPLFRAGVEAALSSSTEIRFIGEADNLGRCTELIEGDKLDVLLIDSSMFGLEAGGARKAALLTAKTSTIVLSAKPSKLEVARAIKSGVAGYLPKTASGDLLIDAIVNAVGGKRYFALSLKQATHGAAIMPDPHSLLACKSLTARERTVLGLISEHQSNKQIASRLGIAEKTVKHHVGAILSKLGVCDRVEAAILSTCWLGANA